MIDKPLLTVSVDFDGTITKSSDSGSPDFNVLRPWCKESMVLLDTLGVKFYLLTGREDRYTEEALNLCRKWELPIDLSNPHRKIIADVYIDDRNLGCTGIDWSTIYYMLYYRVLSIKSSKEKKK